MDTDTRVRSRNKTDARCWRSLIKTSDRISERPPRGGLSVCAYALIQSDNRGTSTLVFYLFFCSKGSGIQSKTLSRPSAHVRFWHKADIPTGPRLSAFGPKADRPANYGYGRPKSITARTKFLTDTPRPDPRRCLYGSGAHLALRRQPVATRR